MKKFLGILVISATMVACNNSSDATDNKVDSTDSAAKAQKEMVSDSANATKNAIDSVHDAKVDSLKANDSSNHK
jgi:hypothetical protein